METMPSVIIEPKVREIINKWLGVFREAAKDVSEFNLLKEVWGSLNENAHTRILSALLRIKPVRNSFFEYLDRKYLGRGLDKIRDAGKLGAGVSVRCFENYIDACVRIGDYCVIVENKIKGASDQPEQIDRYVNSAIGQGVKGENIFVFYVTRDGGTPGDGSFNSSKKILDYDNGCGRFFAISYRQDILPWLYEMLARKIWLGLEIEIDREMLQTGLAQYVNYIEGPDLLNVREVDDGYRGFRTKVVSDIRGLLIDESMMDICTLAEFMVLRQRRYICNAMADELFNKLHLEEKRRILKTIFYDAMGVVIPDTDFYWQVPILTAEADNMVASVGMWEDTGSSLVQVDVWCVDSGGEKYETTLGGLVNNASGLDYISDMKYNGISMLRFKVSRIDHMRRVAGLLSRQSDIGTTISAALTESDVLAEKCDRDYEEWLRQIKSAIGEWRLREHASNDDTKLVLWNSVTQELEDKNVNAEATHSYWYVNDWAIQLYENPDEPMRAIDVFAKRGKGETQIIDLLKSMVSAGFAARALKWDGRVFLRFPTPTMKYAKSLLGALWGWRSKLYN